MGKGKRNRAIKFPPKPPEPPSDKRWIFGAGENGGPLTKADATSERLGWTSYQWELIYALSRLSDGLQAVAARGGV